MIRCFAAIVFLAVVMVAATSAQACGSPNNELRADPAPAKIETSVENVKQPMPEQGGK